MYSAISVVLVLCILEKCDCKDAVSCYYDKCNTTNQVSDIVCNDQKKIMIQSLVIKQITEDACAVNCKNKQGYSNLDDELTLGTLNTYTRVSCSWKSRCSFQVVNAFTTEPNISLFVKMRYSCVNLTNVYMCEGRSTTFQSKTSYHLMASNNTESDAFNQHCHCTIKSNTSLKITIVQPETDIDIKATPQCPILTVTDQTYGCSNQTINHEKQLSAGNTQIELRNIQRNQNIPSIIITPIPKKGEVNDLMCVIAMSSSAAKRGTDCSLVFSLNKVACGPVVTTVTTKTDAATTEATSKGTDDDAGFHVAAAVSVPLTLVAVAAVIVAIIICRRFKQKSMGDSDIYEGSNNKDPAVNQLDNPKINKHDIDANQASIDVYNTIDTVGTEYAECGDIDDINESLKPLDQRHKLGNGARSRQQNGDPYDHLHTPGERVQTDGNYDHLDTKAPSNAVTYSHTNGGNGNSNGPLNDNTTTEVDTYNHLDNGVANAPAKADRMPPHYELLETAGDFASAAAYTDLRGVDTNTPSFYQSLTSQHVQMDDKPNRSESPVMG